ncbi:MAG TPA: hypothetical protein VNY73_01720 [Bacteroidia bacterium]|jgi:hypothetical protein|nr:hypothetical protein [Bacteroidia bacterium]
MKRIFFLSLFFVSFVSFAQTKAGDTLFLLNGRMVTVHVIDTLLGAATFTDPEDSTKRAHVDNEQLFAIRYSNGDIFYYYEQDTISNWFTREEMWLFMQGERDARKGFKAPGSLYGSMAFGLIGGLTGTLFGPLAPLAYGACVGIPWVRIRHNTVSNANNLQYDSYILGYEREARKKRRMKAIIGSIIGMAVGYTTYFVWLQHEPNYPF